MPTYSKDEARVLLSIRAYPDQVWTERTLAQWLEVPRSAVSAAIDRLMECGEIQHIDGEGYKDAS